MVLVDRNLLFLYSENARVKIKELASQLKKSSQRVKYSLDVLEQECMVNNVHCIFDYSYFGVLLFRVYFKGGYIGEEDKVAIIKQLKENKYIMSMYELSGEFDFVVEVGAPNASRFNKELKKIAAVIPTLNHYKIILNVVTHVYPRSYLLLEGSPLLIENERIVGGDRAVQDFTDEEMRLMKELLYYPKIRLTKLAEETELNIKTVNNSLKSLQKRRIIKGFKYLLDARQLGIEKVRLFLKLHNFTPEREAALTMYLLKTRDIVQMNKTVGDWDMEIDLESSDRERVRALIVQIRNEFKDLIEDFNMVEFYQYFKKSFLPGYIFEMDAEEEKKGK